MFCLFLNEIFFMKKINMVDLAGQYKPIASQISEALANVIDTTSFINGPAVSSFQKNLENYLEINRNYFISII